MRGFFRRNFSYQYATIGACAVSTKIGTIPCTLGGKVVNILAVKYNEASGELDEIYLEEVRE